MLSLSTVTWKSIYVIISATFIEIVHIVFFCLTWPVQLTVLFLRIINYKSLQEKKRLESLLKRKKSERKFMLNNMKKIFGNGSSDHRKITSLPIDILICRLQSRKLSALEATVAYIAKALEDTEKYNSVTDFIPDAIGVATALDELPAVKGPLHGLPICIKDDTDVEGVDSTLGYIKNLYRPAKASANIVQALKELGAVPIAKTNVPQAILSNGSSNPIFGQTLNPLRAGMAPGGSSSGTASLVASGGVAFGTGTCFGGSLAVPAHFCGIASIKPTYGRLSSSKINSCIPCPGQSTPGLMAKKPSTILHVFKHLIKNKCRLSRDPTCPPTKWKESLFASREKLRIGYFTSLEFFPSFTDTRETVLKAKRALEANGHLLFPFQMPNSFYFTQLKSDFTFADEGKYFVQMLENEEISSDFFPTWSKFRMPKWIRTLKCYFYSNLWFSNSTSSRRNVILNSGGKVLSADLWKTMLKIESLRDDILSQMKSLQLDLILSPVAAYPALTIEANQKTSTLGSYTSIWNMVNFPTGVTQFGTETGTSIDAYNSEGDELLRVAKNAIQYSIGMPIGVQVIGKPFQEEAVLRLMCELESIYKKS